jgi:hypothetical protein
VKLVALVRCHFGVDVSQLEDDAFAELSAQALWIESYRGEVLKGAIAEVLIKMFDTN